MADIKLFRPQRLTDNPDGGGLATATEIVDGEVNNLFDDISRVKRVNGELSLRKAFAIAATPDTALYSDMHLIVAAPPLDPRVSAVLFRTGVWDDERDDAKAAVERYLDESVISRMIPYDRQLAGQRAVLVFQRPEAALPEIGEVYVLKDDASGASEFIRVQDVDHAVETFTDTVGGNASDFQVRVITLTVTQPLSQEFTGTQPNRYFRADSGAAVVRKTVASDAGRYKGVVVLAEDAAPGDLSIKVESIYAQLVPAATTEVPVTDAQPAGSVSVVAAASGNLTLQVSGNTAPEDRYLPGPISPNTLTFQSPFGGWDRGDDGRGNIVDNATGVTIGSVDYANGRLSLGAGFTTGAGYYNATYTPAAAISRSSLSYEIPVSLSNRGYVYTAALHPVPAPGSTALSYRAQGRWYTIEDDGRGVLAGEAGVGSGLVNFQTGSLQATLGALPDIGSAVLVSYGVSSDYEIRTTDADIKPPEVRGTVAEQSVAPSSFSITWQAGGVAKTATDDGAGNLTGDGTGSVVYGTGDYVLYPTLLPDPNTTYNLSYDAGAPQLDTFTPSKSGASISLQASVVPVRPKASVIEYTGTVTGTFAVYTRTRRVTDNGLGQLLDERGVVIPGSTVDYSTGLYIFNPDFSSKLPSVTYEHFANALPGRTLAVATGAYPVSSVLGMNPAAVDNIAQTVPFQDGTLVTLHYAQDGIADTPQTEEVGTQALKIDLLPSVSNVIVPGGLLFKLGTRTYYERSGTLYYGMDASTGAGTACGSVDYAGGIATLTGWEGGLARNFSVLALLTQIKPLPLSVIHGRTPGSPLRPGTFYIQANRYRDGALITGLADNNGNINTSAMHGVVDVNTGVYAVAFGAYVLDSSLTADDKAEPWYNAADVDADGYIWRPDEVMPGTVAFNCVVQTTLALDPAIIKVNPVRLPLDGRVPVFRAGDTLVISDPQPYTMPNPLTAGQVVTLPRANLDSVALYDANGLGVLPTLYAVDKAAGTVTMADPLDLSAYAEPLVAIHSVEDMAACLDAQITGEVTLGAALSHAYTAGQSLVSSALILGDAQGRYEHLFAQNTWTSVWSDALIGSAPTGGAQYNDALYPITIKNADAVTQRWRLNFTSATDYQVIGETMGVIATGTTGADCAPVNPATGLPYFTLQSEGFGAGWATGNQLRFNTVAAGGPVWVARTVLSGPATEQDDRIRLGVRWDKD